MSFSRVNGTGWAVNDKLTSAQMNALDIDHAKATDGAGGSAGTPYAPTTTLVIGGEGIDHVYLADTTALRAVNTTSLADGSVRWVKGLGRYVLDKTIGPTDAEDLPLVVAPTTGTGRWFSQDQEALSRYVRTFLASGTWVVPRNMILAFVELCGGGAGGGGGTSAGTTGNATGGGGGGAGKRVLGVIIPTPASSIAITVGTAGAGGATGGGNGVAGGDSTVSGYVTSKGGQPSQGTASSTTAVLVPGGVAAQGGVALRAPFAVAGLTSWPVSAGDGGFSQTPGATIGSSSPGGSSTEGYAGGAVGANGTTSGADLGGVGGAGGGAGPSGPGGNGGAGGNGNNAGAGVAGSNGVAASANTGAGGGGGGGGGTGSASGGAGGIGGAGGTGFVIIRGWNGLPNP